MKFDINNPAFLQAAGSISTESSIVARFTTSEAIFQINRGTGGTVFITRTLGGELTTYSDDIDTATGELLVSADPQTDVTIRGDIISLTDLKEDGIYINLKYLDISKCRNLASLVLGNDLESLGEIKARATSMSVADGIAAAITKATTDPSIDSVVYLKQGDEFNSIVLTAAQNMGWEVRYF